MAQFEYKVVAAPTRGEKARGAKTSADRFGVALTNLLNTLAQDGWQYQRADTLPCEERVGFTGKATVFQNMLVFRRSVVDAVPAQPSGTVVAGGAVVTGPNFAPISAVAPAVDAVIPRLGAAEVPGGPAPAVGPVRPELAAE